VPITALRVRPWTKFLVWELGIDRPGEMDFHLQIANPTISCVTGISPVHTDSDHMGSLANLILEKQKIIQNMPETGTAILNHDDENVKNMSGKTKAKIVWFGSTKDCDIYFDKNSIKIDLDGTSADFYIEGKKTILKTTLIGAHQVYNIMAAYLTIASAVKKPFLDIFQRNLMEITPIRGRMNVEKGPTNTILLNDSLRASPTSTYFGLKTLEKINYSKGRKIAVVGEMGELADPEAEHEKTGRELANMKIDYVICIGPLRKFTMEEAIKSGFPKEKIIYAKDIFEATSILKKYLKPGDLWYLKGSLLRNYKRIVQLLNNDKICCREIMCPYEHCGY